MRNLIKIFIMTLIIVVTVVCLCFIVNAAENTVDFAGGDGSKDNPYKVSTTVHLNNVRNYLDAHFVQIKDIDMTYDTQNENGAYYNDGKGWLPIGDDYANRFTGTYDGGGHKIVGLNINRIGDLSLYVGLFGYNGGTTKNLGIVNGNIRREASSGTSYVGGIAGYNSGIIMNCYNTNDIFSSTSKAPPRYSRSYAGGIAGGHGSGIIANCYNKGGVFSAASTGSDSSSGGITGENFNGTIVNCYNSNEVSSASDNAYRSYAGGIVGQNYGAMTSCYNTGNISSSGADWSNAGGVAGYHNWGTITNCYSTNNAYILASSASNEDSRSQAGGITGYNDNYGIIKNCYSTAIVSSTAYYASYVGGISGYNNRGTIMDCYNTGDVSSFYSAGGIVGSNWGTITNCYNTGNVSASIYVGSIVGYNDKNTAINHCCWNVESDQTANGISRDNDSKTGVGMDFSSSNATMEKDTEYMQSSNFVDMLNQNVGLETIWHIDITKNDGYPIFEYLLTNIVYVDVSGIEGLAIGSVTANVIVTFNGNSLKRLHFIKNVTIRNGTTILPIATYHAPEGTEFIKIFFWDGIDTMRPLMGAVEIK